MANRNDDKRKTPRASKATYQPPTRMEIPEDVKNRFANLGYALRWIRVRKGNMEDAQHIAKRRREGYNFVKPEDAQDLIAFLGLVVSPGEQMIMNGDNALSQILIEKQEARQQYYEDMARMNENAIAKNLEKQSSRTMPIFNNSRSFVTRGINGGAGQQGDEE